MAVARTAAAICDPGTFHGRLLFCCRHRDTRWSDGKAISHFPPVRHDHCEACDGLWQGSKVWRSFPGRPVLDREGRAPTCEPPVGRGGMPSSLFESSHQNGRIALPLLIRDVGSGGPLSLLMTARRKEGRWRSLLWRGVLDGEDGAPSFERAVERRERGAPCLRRARRRGRTVLPVSNAPSRRGRTAFPAGREPPKDRRLCGARRREESLRRLARTLRSCVVSLRAAAGCRT